MLNPKLVQFMLQLQNQDETSDKKFVEKTDKKEFSSKKYGMFLPLKFAQVQVKS